MFDKEIFHIHIWGYSGLVIFGKIYSLVSPIIYWDNMHFTLYWLSFVINEIIISFLYNTTRTTLVIGGRSKIDDLKLYIYYINVEKWFKIYYTKED